MKNHSILLLFLLFFSTGILAQEAQEINVVSDIRNVTVFLQGAQITRTAKARLPAGRSELVFSKLSPLLDPGSIRVKTEGDFLLLSVNHYLNYLDEPVLSGQLRSIKVRIEALQDSIEYLRALQTVLTEEENFLKENRSIRGDQTGYELDDLKAINQYFAEKMKALKSENLSIRKQILRQEKETADLQKQLREFNSRIDLNSSEIVLTVSAQKPVEVDLEIAYLCEGANWFPNYDLRVQDVENPVELVYKALLRQNTGEDWKNVRLRFSNADPYQSGVAPTLDPYYLDFVYTRPVAALGMISRQGINLVTGKVVDPQGNPLIGANILVKGTSVGTVTDLDGNFSLNLPADASSIVVNYTGYDAQELPITGGNMNVVLEEGALLEEVVVSGLARRAPGLESRAEKERKPLPAVAIENQTTVEFELDIPYTVLSNGELYTLALANYDIPAVYHYQVVPRIRQEAYLIARIVDWDQYNILEGEANLFFEDTYLGKSILDVRFAADTLAVSLGRDQGIVVKREKVTDFTKKQLLGNKQTENRSFRITLRNNKPQPVRLVLKDQIPVSRTSDIEVAALELSGGQWNSETGEVAWNIALEPGRQVEILLQYQVRYPKDRYLDLE